jgi:hypothetical protein
MECDGPAMACNAFATHVFQHGKSTRHSGPAADSESNTRPVSPNRRPGRPLFQQAQDTNVGCNTHAEWLEKWAPECPDGDPQRLCELLGFRLKGRDHLQLRVVLRSLDRGVCQLIIEEHPDRVYVRALACEHEDESGSNASVPQETDCPCNVWLDAPLDERIVVDIDSGRPLPLFVPGWGSGKPSIYVPRPTGSLWPPPPLSSTQSRPRGRGQSS